MVNLRKGDEGDAVERLQLLLRSALVPPVKLAMDGDFGQRTDDAVRRFQRQCALKDDGVVGPRTWTALGQNPGPLKVVADLGSDRTKKETTPKSWMEIAEAEMGVSENSQRGRENDRIVEYHHTTTYNATTDETPWCSSFVNWVLIEAGYKGTNNALAKSWLDWGAEAKPVYGAVTVIKKKNATSDKLTGSSTGFHVGFFVSAPAGHVRLLGGNQGDKVSKWSVPLSGWDVRGYRLP